ncbi:acyl carrier protein [Nocardia aurantia]|uniref:Acyl carrier protein n=1 Tax=Nocardia aurantia TaxID=2585199 RepID=A0A7K0DGW4_9NOCA|nr:acyl carrier protein [Nocardia aurantia]MQY24919.1 Acyl carrier protein [Nocardia aurantia]
MSVPPIGIPHAATPEPMSIAWKARILASNNAGISEALEQILREELQIDTSRFSRESHLIDEVGLDSVGFAVGMVAIEERLGIALSEEDLLSCDTVGDLDDIVTNRATEPAR